MIIRAPDVQGQSHVSDQLTELVDVFPTLCDLADIEIPENQEGVSAKPLLGNPEKEWKTAVFSQYVRRIRGSGTTQRYMGYSMITKNYHYVEWRYWDFEQKAAGDLAATELYNMKTDPAENVNISSLPENREVIEQLARQLQAGWRRALPKT